MIEGALIISGSIMLAAYMLMGQASRFHIRLREDLRLIADRLLDIQNSLDKRR